MVESEPVNPRERSRNGLAGGPGPPGPATRGISVSEDKVSGDEMRLGEDLGIAGNGKRKLAQGISPCPITHSERTNYRPAGPSVFENPLLCSQILKPEQISISSILSSGRLESSSLLGECCVEDSESPLVFLEGYPFDLSCLSFSCEPRVGAEELPRKEVPVCGIWKRQYDEQSIDSPLVLNVGMSSENPEFVAILLFNCDGSIKGYGSDESGPFNVEGNLINQGLCMKKRVAGEIVAVYSGTFSNDDGPAVTGKDGWSMKCTDTRNKSKSPLFGQWAIHSPKSGHEFVVFLLFEPDGSIQGHGNNLKIDGTWSETDVTINMRVRDEECAQMYRGRVQFGGCSVIGMDNFRMNLLPLLSETNLMGVLCESPKWKKAAKIAKEILDIVHCQLSAKSERQPADMICNTAKMRLEMLIEQLKDVSREVLLELLEHQSPLHWTTDDVMVMVLLYERNNQPLAPEITAFCKRRAQNILFQKRSRWEKYNSIFKNLERTIEQAVEQHLWNPVKYLKDSKLLRVDDDVPKNELDNTMFLGFGPFIGFVDTFFLVVRDPVDNILKCFEETVPPSDTSSKPALDAVIFAHGAIGQQLVDLPNLKHTKRVTLYTPWNCAMDDKAAPGIVSGKMEPQNRMFEYYGLEKRENEPIVRPRIPPDWNTILGDKGTCASDTTEGISFEVKAQHACTLDKAKRGNIFNCSLMLDSKWLPAGKWISPPEVHQSKPRIPPDWNTNLGDKGTCASDTTEGISVEVKAQRACTLDKAKRGNIFNCSLMLDSKLLPAGKWISPPEVHQSKPQANPRIPKAESRVKLGQSQHPARTPEILLAAARPKDIKKILVALNTEAADNLQSIKVPKQERASISEDGKLFLPLLIALHPYERCHLVLPFEHILRMIELVGNKVRIPCNVHLVSCLNSVAGLNSDMERLCEEQYAVVSNGVKMTSNERYT